MLKIKNNFFITVFVLIFVIFTAIIGNSFLFFKVSSEKKSIIELRKTVLQNKKKNEEGKLLSDALGRLKKEKDTINAVFLKENELVSLIKSLESSGDNSGVYLKISSISPSVGEGDNPKISFIAKGSFEQLFRYLYMVENIPYLVTIDKVSLQNIKNEKISHVDYKSSPSYDWQALFSAQLESYEKN